MKPKTEELLYLLLWTCETLSRPTFRNLTDSFEGWAYHHGFHRQLQRLEKQKLIERQPNRPGIRWYRLTEVGRCRALGGRDPLTRWRRRWDGHWRLVLFDVPEVCKAARNQVRRYLRSRGFGYLQDSVWITPDPVNEDRAQLADGPVNVEALVLLDARPCTGETDAQIVAGAWDFADLNQRYEAHQAILDRRPCRPLDRPEAADAFHRWLRAEQAAWQDAMLRDPLLPAALLPPGYAGQEAWRHRLAAMAEAGNQMRALDGGLIPCGNWQNDRSLNC